MKKTFVLLLALCMAAVFFAVPVFAEGDGNAQPAAAPVNTQQALEQALAAAAPAGDTVTLAADITLTAPITVPAKVTLDGAGKTLTANFDSSDDLTSAVTSAVVYAYGNVQNLTVNASNRVKYAVQVYGETANVTLTSVAMQNGKYSGLVVNNGASASRMHVCGQWLQCGRAGGRQRSFRRGAEADGGQPDGRGYGARRCECERTACAYG